MLFDPSTEFGARVERHLKQDIIAWLTTVRPNGTPEPSPVWFLWDGESCVVYSRPNTQKLRDLATNPRVAVNFDGDGKGGDIVIFTGEAHVDPTIPPSNALTAYQEKYRSNIERIGSNPDHFAAGYSVPLRIVLSKLRGH